MFVYIYTYDIDVHVYTGIKKALAKRAAAATAGQTAQDAVNWITTYLPKEAEKRAIGSI